MDEELRALIEKVERRMAEEQAAPRQRTRTALQGLTFGFSDEAEAALRSIFSPQSYSENVADIRGSLEAYKQSRPGEALAYEIGGAVLPTVAALAAAPFTGGTSTAVAAPTIARLARVGAGQGALTAIGTGEGNVQERLTRAPGGAVTGAVGGAALGGASIAAGGAFNRLVDVARRRIGGRGSSIVENEIQRLVRETGKTPDEIAQDVIDGRILAENRTIQAAVRAVRASGGDASRIIGETMARRPAQTREQAMTVMRQYLSDIDQPSALQARRRSEEAARIAEREAYAPFATIQANETVSRQVLSALQVVPEAAEEINKMWRGLVSVTEPANGIGPPRVSFTRPITIQEAESVRRAIGNSATAEYTASRGGAGEVFKAAERTLRNALDTEVPELAAARAMASGIRSERDAFEAGRRAFSGDINERLMEFSEISDPQAIQAYRAGLMAAIEARGATSSRIGMIRDMADPTKKEGMILQEVFPGESVEDVMNAVERAAASQAAQQGVMGGSQTFESFQEQARQGAGLSVSDISGLMSLDVGSMFGVANSIAKRFARNMSEEEYGRIARILVSEDPEMVRRALRDESAMAALQEKVQRLSRAITRGAGRAGAVISAPYGGEITQQSAQGLMGYEEPR
jgi:hypothetical protein